jgi:hemerythrin-like domain-containing protein
MLATDVLKNEHRAIEQMLDVVEVAASRLEACQEVPPDIFSQAADFFRNFADACHHAKEEDLLFPLLETRGLKREGGPIGVMLSEHEQGRAYVGAIAQAVERYADGDTSAAQTLVENSRGYVGLLRQHILKEDTVLFNMADNLLSPDDQSYLVEQFEQVETERIGPGVHERYHQLLDELKELVAGWRAE